MLERLAEVERVEPGVREGWAGALGLGGVEGLQVEEAVALAEVRPLGLTEAEWLRLPPAREGLAEAEAEEVEVMEGEGEAVPQLLAVELALVLPVALPEAPGLPLGTALAVATPLPCALAVTQAVAEREGRAEAVASCALGLPVLVALALLRGLLRLTVAECVSVAREEGLTELLVQADTVPETEEVRQAVEL